ncbi:MAG: MotA/TolQ/ExbB proton channel family protein [Candidatus Acididesulfobacter guangdongensis]|uniref:MotA/TolQ/ExbB proton channel family protein n=1 Tax=Acididesulfobacter guangdongensis TaxID=2597225 RepID=A0A519BJ12_ACIG2|nr:MAG: MotA/TolQ/ExbB proton channel family protein [Candidatus Acididesulfobacter guangdongensis]
MNLSYIVHIASVSGGVLYLIMIVLLVALTVIIERTLYLNKLINKGREITSKVSELKVVDDKILSEIVQSSDNVPQAKVLNVALNFPEVRSHDHLDRLLEEEIMWQSPAIDKRLWILDSIVTLAPLLGLLGTIVGMFTAFSVLGAPGSAPLKVTGGVAEALVTTGAGLFVAIIGLVFYNGLNNWVRLIVHQMETLKIMLVNRLERPCSKEDKVSGPELNHQRIAEKGKNINSIVKNPFTANEEVING